MRKLTSILIIFMVFTFGCAKKMLTPEQAATERERQIRMTTRTYEGKSPKDILLAADRIFRLDDSDYQIKHSEDSLQAQRNWFVYMVIAAASGVDTWIIQATPTENGTKVVAQCATQGQSIVPMSTMGLNGQVGATAGTSPTLAGLVTSQALYDLFYARMDYLLGKSEKWVTCKEAKTMFHGITDPLCICADDLLPDGTKQTRSN